MTTDWNLDLFTKAPAETVATQPVGTATQVEAPSTDWNLDLFTGPSADGSKMNKIDSVPTPVAEGESLRERLQGAKEIAANTVLGPIGMIAATPIAFAATGAQKILEKTGILPVMPDEELRARRERMIQGAATLGGALEPKTETGQAGMEMVGKVFEPISTAASYYAGIIDPKVHPHLNDLGKFGVETLLTMGVFGAIGKTAQLAKLKQRFANTKGAIKERLGKKITETESAMLNDLEAKMSDLSYAKEVINPERFALIKNQYQQKILSIENDPKILPKDKKRLIREENKAFNDKQQRAVTTMKEFEEWKKSNANAGKTLEEMMAERRQKNQQLLTGYEPPAAAPENLAAMQTKVYQAPPVPERAMTSRSQSVVSTEAPVVRPNLGPEPVSGSPAPTPVETVQLGGKPEPVTAETVPQREYRVNPETGQPELVRDISERSTYQAGSGGVQLVESVPGLRQVWQIAKSTLSNERGAVDLDLLKSTFGLKAIPVERIVSQMKKLGVSEKDLMSSGFYSMMDKKKGEKLSPEQLKVAIEDTNAQAHITQRRHTDTFANQRYGGAPLTTPGGLDPKVKTFHLNDPNKPNRQYTEVHFSQGNYPREMGQNTLMHMRTAVHKVGDKIAAHINELQSKWLKEEIPEAVAEQNELIKHHQDFIDWGMEESGSRAFIDRAQARIKALEDMPLKENWYKVALRDHVAEAVKNGSDVITWTKAAEQRQRYPNVDTNFELLYDQMMVKFFEKEFGVKPQEGELGWQVPVNSKMRRMFKEGGKFELDKTAVQKELTDTINERQRLQQLRQDMREGRQPVKDWENIIAQEDALIKKQLELENKHPQATIADLSLQPKEMGFFDILMKTLQSEGGFLEFNRSKGKGLSWLKEKITPEQRDQIRRIARSALDSGMEIGAYLKGRGATDEQIKTFEKLYQRLRPEKPFETMHVNPAPTKGPDPMKMQPEDVNANIMRGANEKVPVPARTVKGAQEIGQGITMPIMRPFTTSWKFIKDTGSPMLQELWHKVNGIEAKRLEDIAVLQDTVKQHRETFPDVRKREEAYLKVMSQDPRGRKAIEKAGYKPIEANTPIEYEGLVPIMKELFDDMIGRINESRDARGSEKLAYLDHYMPMIAQERLWDHVMGMFDKNKEVAGRPNLVLDSPEAINHRYHNFAMDSTRLPFTQRGKLRRGIKLETDPLQLYLDYGQLALKHIHYSPFNAFIKELTSNRFVDPKTGERTWTMKEKNDQLHAFLTRWSNKLAGMPNANVWPGIRILERATQKLTNNLTAATLGWSLRTMLVQPTSLIPTMTEFGLQGTTDALIKTAFNRSKNPWQKSNVLKIRTADAFIGDTISRAAQGPIRRGLALPADKALSFMKAIDATMAKATWEAAYEASKNNPKLSEGQRIRLADEAVVRTQGSGFVGDLSPIQMNALGKALTLWQTYTINHMNWIAKEVLDMKHPERNPGETFRRVTTYMVATAAVNTLFEDVLGIQSPSPAPIKEIIKSLKDGDTKGAAALKGMLEMTEAIPIMSNLKYGSSFGGASVEFLDQLSKAVSEDMPKALNGDSKAAQRIGFTAAKLLGVPGTEQIRKVTTGIQKNKTLTQTLLGGQKEVGSTRRSSRARRVGRRLDRAERR